MAITIKGIRIDDIAVTWNIERGAFVVSTASYSLISSVDKVLAKQSIGGYGAMVLEPSPDTIKALEAFTASYKRDVTATLGLE